MQIVKGTKLYCLIHQNSDPKMNAGNPRLMPSNALRAIELLPLSFSLSSLPLPDSESGAGVGDTFAVATVSVV